MKRLAEALSNATDRLNEKLEVVERALSAIQMGISAEVYLSDEIDEREALTFRKRQNSWGLFIDPDPTRQDVQLVSLTSASRELRLKAIKKIPELIDQLLSAMLSELEEVRKGHASLDSIVADLVEAGS